MMFSLCFDCLFWGFFIRGFCLIGVLASRVSFVSRVGNYDICVIVFQITELLTDVERLKQALSGLSQLAYTSNTPSKRQTQHTEALQAQIKSLQQQLAVSTPAILYLLYFMLFRHKFCV